MRSERNKTIDLPLEALGTELGRCISPTTPLTAAEALDKTILGDCLAAMELLPRGFADLVIADPPYNLDKSFGGNSFRHLSDADYMAYTESWLDKVQPLLSSGGSIYVCCDWRCSGIIGEALSRRFTVRSRITWQREKGRGAAKNWKNSTEDIWFATVGEDYYFDLEAVKVKRKVMAPYKEDGRPKDWEESSDGRWRLTCPGNFWDDITVPYWSMAENTAHPTQKPEKLLAKLILASSRPGDTVFDPFLGSGSTSVTAKKLGRHYCGIEQNPLYCAWAELRLDRADSDKSIQGLRDGVFLERNMR